MKHLLRLLLLLATLSTARAAIVANSITTNSIGKMWAVSAPATIASAVAKASAGDTVVVYAGNYNEHNILKPGVNYYFYPGASNSWTSTSYSLADGLGIIDDRGTGATTNIVSGSGVFFFSGGTNLFGSDYGNTNAVGALVLTNPSSRIIWEFDTIDGDAFPATVTAPINGIQSGQALFYISRCARCDIVCRDIRSSNRYQTQNGNASYLSGMYWEAGETYLTFGHMDPFIAYGIWANEQSTGAQNLWVNGDLCEGYLYGSATTANFRCWFRFNELRVTNGLANDAAGWLGGGRWYIQAEKVSTLNVSLSAACVRTSNGAESWTTAQKLSSATGGQWAVNAGGTNYVSALQYEGLGTNAVGGFVNSGGFMSIEGGEGLCNGVGVSHSGGRTVIKNVTLCTTNGNFATNFPVIASAAGLSIQGGKLVAPAACTNAIYATSAQTVAIYGSSGNRTNNSNITLSPNGGWTVDANVR